MLTKFERFDSDSGIDPVRLFWLIILLAWTNILLLIRLKLGRCWWNSFNMLTSKWDSSGCQGNLVFLQSNGYFPDSTSSNLSNFRTPQVSYHLYHFLAMICSKHPYQLIDCVGSSVKTSQVDDNNTSISTLCLLTYILFENRDFFYNYSSWKKN